MVTAATKPAPYQFILLDRTAKRPSDFSTLRPHVVASTIALRSTLIHANRDSLWVSYAPDLTEALVRNVPAVRHALGAGLFLHPLDAHAIPPLTSVFRRIAFSADGGFLAPDELAEALHADNRADLFLGGSVDTATETITFWRGDLKPLTAPFSAFTSSGDGPEPDFNRLWIIDCGQTVRLGDYEAAVDAILYERDPTYRRRIARRRRLEDRSFGAALRRLRKQRGLRREDFQPALAAKTIARIEQGRVKRIHRKTLIALAARLDVRAEEIGTY